MTTARRLNRPEATASDNSAASRRIRLCPLVPALALITMFAIPAELRAAAPHHHGNAPARSSTVSAGDGKVHLGIDVLAASGFKILSGKRVGLLTNPAGVNRDGVSTIDVLRRSPVVNLVALYGPEHGIYGDEKANVPIEDRIDPRTGLPVYSLYGQYRKPTPAMLQDIDVMVIDLQDLGVRSYTYVSCMRLTIEACFEQNVAVVILDRPNPLGGLKVDGPMLERQWMSYVGAYPVPYVHGLTIGELALMARAQPGWLQVDDKVRRHGALTVVPMRGWQRRMLWPDTGLRWVPTSPAIPDVSAALGYAMTGLGGQLGGFRHGYGTPYPFRLLNFPNRSPEDIARALGAARIPGLEIVPVDFTDSRGRRQSGAYVKVTDYAVLHPTDLSFWMMKVACQWNSTNPFAAASKGQGDLFNKHVGSTEWWQAITTQGASVQLEPFFTKWRAEARQFQQTSRQYWIYQ